MELIPELVCRYQIAFCVVNRELTQTRELMAEDFTSIVCLDGGRICHIESSSTNCSVSVGIGATWGWWQCQESVIRRRILFMVCDGDSAARSCCSHFIGLSFSAYEFITVFFFRRINVGGFRVDLEGAECVFPLVEATYDNVAWQCKSHCDVHSLFVHAASWIVEHHFLDVIFLQMLVK